MDIHDSLEVLDSNKTKNEKNCIFIRKKLFKR